MTTKHKQNKALALHVVGPHAAKVTTALESYYGGRTDPGYSLESLTDEISIIRTQVTDQEHPWPEDGRVVVYVQRNQDLQASDLTAFVEKCERYDDNPNVYLVITFGEGEAPTEIAQAMISLAADRGVGYFPSMQMFLNHIEGIEASTEGLKDALKAVKDFFTPLPKTHVDKARKKVFGFFDVAFPYNRYINFMNTYYNNPAWQARQEFIEGQVAGEGISNYLTVSGKFSPTEWQRDLDLAMKDLRALTRKFDEEMAVYVDETRKIFRTADAALRVIGVFTQKPNPIAEAILIDALRKKRALGSVLKTINLAAYKTLGSSGRVNADGTLARAVSNRVTALTAEGIRDAVAYVENMRNEQLDIVMPAEIIWSDIDPNSDFGKFLAAQPSGAGFLEEFSEWGVWNQANPERLPLGKAYERAIAQGILNWAVASIKVKDPLA